jgi:hypothetical protein
VSHAVLASDLYVRHPEIEAWAVVEPRVHAAVLWPKRLDVVASAYLEPLRAQYYLHHPRGRMNAKFVGVLVPAFYANVTPPAVPAADLKAKLTFKVFTPPTPEFTASARAVWIAAPSADWQAKVSAKAATPRAKLDFYVRPPKLAAKAILGAEVKGKIATLFAMQAPRARGQLDAKWGLALGHSIKLAAPDLNAAAEARAQWQAEAPGGAFDVDSHHALNVHAPKAKLNAQGKGKLASAVKLEAKGKALSAAAGDAKAQGNGKAQAGLKLKGPEIKAPSVKAEAKGSASFKLGR